ncbi:hypothetical protein TNCV_3544221 [Trichonephila clavipes]|nr:hypothetical protein TNCV_3544221 [Trichonephila clavipes]
MKRVIREVQSGIIFGFREKRLEAFPKRLSLWTAPRVSSWLKYTVHGKRGPSKITFRRGKCGVPRAIDHDLVGQSQKRNEAPTEVRPWARAQSAHALKTSCRHFIKGTTFFLDKGST